MEYNILKSIESSGSNRVLKVNVHHLLYGEELEDLGRTSFMIEDGYIVEIKNGWYNDADVNGGVAIPLPVNAHVHLNDYRVLEHYYGLTLEQYVGFKGLKHSLITLYKDPLIPRELLDVLVQYGLIIDYQEIVENCRVYSEVFKAINVKYYGLHEYYGLLKAGVWDVDVLEQIVSKCNGLAIGNPLRIPPYIIHYLSDLSRKTIVSAHVSETKYMAERGDLHYMLANRINLKHVVHGVFLEDWEFKILADNDIILVVNPRSNIWFTGRVANVVKALEHGVKIAIGTDNAGVFHPDVWIEAHLLENYLKINPKTILEMLFVNGYHAVGEKPYFITEGDRANVMIVDLGLANERSGNIYLSLINRLPWSRSRIIIKHDKVFKITTSLTSS